MITELDIDVLPREPAMWGADLREKAAIRATTNIYPDGLPRRAAAAARAPLRRHLRAVPEAPQPLSRVTFWGVTDAQSWLHDFPIPGRVNYPLLWDREGRPKPAFDAVAVKVLRTKTMSAAYRTRIRQCRSTSASTTCCRA